MEKQIPPISNETRSEALLRTTLQKHTSHVDLNSAWATVAERLSIQDRQVQQSRKRKLLALPFHSSLFGRRLRTVPVMAAAVMLAVCLMGVGVVVAYSGGGASLKEAIGLKMGFPPASQYHNIGQQQQSNGVTITLGKAYAASDHTVISFTVQLSPTLLKDYVGAFPESFHFVVNGVGEQLTVQKMLDCNVDLVHHMEYCELALSPLRSSASAKEFNITWDLTEVILDATSTSAVKPHILRGHWHFQFTLPRY